MKEDGSGVCIKAACIPFGDLGAWPLPEGQWTLCPEYLEYSWYPLDITSNIGQGSGVGSRWTQQCLAFDEYSPN